MLLFEAIVTYYWCQILQLLWGTPNKCLHPFLLLANHSEPRTARIQRIGYMNSSTYAWYGRCAWVGKRSVAIFAFQHLEEDRFVIEIVRSNELISSATEGKLFDYTNQNIEFKMISLLNIVLFLYILDSFVVFFLNRCFWEATRDCCTGEDRPADFVNANQGQQQAQCHWSPQKSQVQVPR